MNEVKITAVRTSGEVFKAMTNSGRPGFGIMVVYTLADAREVDSKVTRQRKKDVLPAVESARESINSGSMSASFHEGKFWGTVRKFSIEKLTDAAASDSGKQNQVYCASERSEVMENLRLALLPFEHAKTVAEHANSGLMSNQGKL